MTESRHLAERLEYLSGHDELTGLLNRLELMREMEELLDSGFRSDYKSPGRALLYMDIDQFRMINDSHGHVTGDRFLCALGHKLSGLVGPSDLVARLGGDEFAILLSDISEFGARQLADRIRSAIESFRHIEGDEKLSATVSIGVVSFLVGEANVTEIMTRADSACYNAKQGGGNAVHMFRKDEAGEDRLYGGIRHAADVQEILESEQFEFYAQMIKPREILESRPECLELLIRAKKPDGTFMSNSRLIPTIEEFQFGQKLDAWVLKNGFQQLIDLGYGDRHPPFKVSFNVSGQSLGQGSFLNAVVEYIKYYAIPADRSSYLADNRHPDQATDSPPVWSQYVPPQ